MSLIYANGERSKVKQTSYHTEPTRTIHQVALRCLYRNWSTSRHHSTHCIPTTSTKTHTHTRLCPGIGVSPDEVLLYACLFFPHACFGGRKSIALLRQKWASIFYGPCSSLIPAGAHCIFTKATRASNPRCLPHQLSPHGNTHCTPLLCGGKGVGI